MLGQRGLEVSGVQRAALIVCAQLLVGEVGPAGVQGKGTGKVLAHGTDGM